MKRVVRDPYTRDMFEVPVERQPLPGALNVALPLRSLLASMMKASPLTRLQLAARMSELTGLEITEDQLNSWTAPSREGWRFPLEYLPAFEAALETHELMAWLADLRGARLSVGREALEAQLGKVERMKDELSRQEKALKKMLGDK